MKVREGLTCSWHSYPRYNGHGTTTSTMEGEFMTDLTQKPLPHPHQDFFKSRGVPVANLARYCGVSYSHMADVLSGRSRASEKLEGKLEEAKAEVERG